MIIALSHATSLEGGLCFIYIALFAMLVPVYQQQKMKQMKFNLHDTGAVCQVRVRIAVVDSHLRVFWLWVVLSATRIRFHLLFKREGVGEDSEALLQLPATSFTDRLRSADGFCQHEGANHSQQLYEGHS